MTENASKVPNHWPLLDFLRAAAALLVLLGHTRAAYFHYTVVLAQPGLFLKLFYFITSLDGTAVVIFFVLSGFLIGGSLADSMQRGSFDLVRYLVARFVRIYIVYIPALVITEAVFLFCSILLSDPGAVDNPPLFGLLGAGLIIAGLARQLLSAAGRPETDTIIAAGFAIVFACRPMVEFRLAPRLSGWAAGFSYTLYAIHFPLVFLIVAIFQNIGFPRDQGPPSPLLFMEFGVTIAICLLAAFLVSLVSERKTGQLRAAMMRMRPPRAHRKASDRG
jgi:peptidoglycan/LPS O-acetylase OafA/YrhL